jgi:nitrite reductase (NADH) small subunit
LPPLSGCGIAIGVHRVAVFRTASGQLYAVEDRCPHRGAELANGAVYEHYVACRDHGWSIDLRDGCVAAPDCGRVRVFAARENTEGEIEVAVG